MRKTFLAVFLLVAGLAAIPGGAAEIAAVQSADGSVINWRSFIGSNQSATIGWSFTATQDMQVTALGLYTPALEGLVDSHPVGIWSGEGALLAQIVIPSGIPANMGSYLFESITPVNLISGNTYVLGAYFGPVPSVCSGSACGDVLLYNGTETYAPGITFLQSLQTFSAIGPGSLTFPTVNAGLPEGLFGPNFLIEQLDEGSAVPKPSSMGLIGLGLGVLLARAGPRRKAKP